MENLPMFSYDSNGHMYYADTNLTDILRLYAPDADEALYSAPAEELEGWGKTEDVSPIAVCLDQILRQFAQDRDEAYNLCQLNRTADAAEVMLGFLQWVVSDTVLPGLLDDNVGVYPIQLEFWKDLNICCLAIWQRQKDLTQALPTEDTFPSICLSIAQIETFGDELIRIGDQLAKHGLVDYEVGIWEEEILSVIEQCFFIERSTIKEVASNQILVEESANADLS